MFKKITHFIKYNNAMVLILVLIFVVGSGVFAQTETGQEFIGEKTTRIEGFDNALLFEADLDNFQMDFKIESIEEDEKYFYVKYTCIDLVEEKDAWQYQINEKIRKVSKKFRGDLGDYMAQELQEEYDARIKVLKSEKEAIEDQGIDLRTEITEYSGLIGKTLDTVSKVFPNYNPVKQEELLSPAITFSLADERSLSDRADDLTDVYSDYMERMDPDEDAVLGILDNCPDVANPDQEDRDDDGLGDACDEYFTLKPVLDEEEIPSTDATSSDEVASSSEEAIDDEDVVDETASSSEDVVPEIIVEEEQEVEVIELPVPDVNVGTST